jgi:quinol monooxygenase YgiN
MAFVRSYLMIAKDDKMAELEEALRSLAAKITAQTGCIGTELYQDAAKPERFTFLERWESVDAQQAGGKAVGKEAFAPIMAALATPPEAASLTPLL